MDELKNQLVEKLGIDESMANSAIEMVLGFVKDKLPEGLQGPLESVMKGEDVSDSALDAVKGLFGN